MADLLVLNPADTVAILTARGVAPAGHKIARAAIARGAAVVKYGQIIGYATCDIAAGDHVHSHNLPSAITTATRPRRRACGRAGRAGPPSWA
ncbi:SAF domain-containing protein, partial [Paracoccus sp. PAMC 22219]|uniref:SAF domain-containing protein n=1 Tax=Paracoccus sp. PAMC 22219 TaxID=1569209 RepID=UPI0035A6CA91